MTVLNDSWVINLRSSEKKMKVQETFYTISAEELKILCRRFARKGFAKDDADSEFEMFYFDQIHNLTDRKRISALDFTVTVGQDG